MNQSKTFTDEDSLKNDLPKPRVKGIDLSGIPHFSPTTSQPSTASSPMAPPSCNEKAEAFEYEFSINVRGTPLFVTLWDSNDLSACQRACSCNLTADEITYSETGNGFFTVREERWCFKKQPYQRSWNLHNEVAAGTDTPPNEPKRQKPSPITADAILATL